LGNACPANERSWLGLDQLQANLEARIITVVITSTSERTSTKVPAPPVVGCEQNTVIAPYDLSALEAVHGSA